MMKDSQPTTTNGEHDPHLSGLHAFIAEQRRSPQRPTASRSPSSLDANNLALQVAHNLRFQHNWSDIRVHHRASERPSAHALPRPLITGLPPQRLYVHPDEQIEALNKQRNVGKAGWPEMGAEREWVLPTHLRESWTLRRFAEVFDALSTVPSPENGGALFNEADRMVVDGQEAEGEHGADGQQTPNPWRTTQPKRLLLATLEDDSTIVYYVIHDGIVKPRQN
ncbi:hypothetical protein LTR08_001876 [Meristemomyces frigidus]|nr:hypothetical protein LTR08_001876 [Meristemomyces frigidus]